MTLAVVLGGAAATVLAMEAASYVLHRWLLHGLLWPVHKSHHSPRLGRFEANDLISATGALVAIAACVGAVVREDALLGAIGLGMTTYGALYFVVHDLFIHGRFLAFESEARWLHELKEAHLAHHRTVSRAGGEPYGLLFVGRERQGERGGPPRRH